MGWGISAVGSAFEWHSKGRGFESHMLHERESLENTRYFVNSGFSGIFLYITKSEYSIVRYDGPINNPQKF